MRLFRSEEHVHRAYREPEAIFSAETLWRLAQSWYGDRLEPSWNPRSIAESQVILEQVGLRGEFWRLR